MIHKNKLNSKNCDIREIELTPELSLLNSGRRSVVSCGQKVIKGDLLASSECSWQGDLLAPASGEILELDRWHIVMGTTYSDDAALEPDEQEDINGLSGQMLHNRLSMLGLSCPEPHFTDTLIINAAHPEPGIVLNELLLNKFGPILMKGVDGARKLYAPTKVVFAVTEGTDFYIEGCEKVKIQDHYPDGLEQMVVKSVTGKEKAEAVTVLDLNTLYELGYILQWNKPLFHTFVQAGDGFYKVKIGTPIGIILYAAGKTVHHHSRVVLGSRMRGMAAYSLSQGIEKDSLALFIIDKTKEPIAEDTPCVGCGECVRHCPARIDPSFLSGCAEFKLYEEARKNFIDSCIDCGLCSYVCIARRPVLQWIRLAKRELFFIDGACSTEDAGLNGNEGSSDQNQFQGSETKIGEE